MRYISIVLLLSFTVTSSYGAVGLRTTPIRALAEGSQVDGTHPRLNSLDIQTDRIEDRLYANEIRGNGYAEGRENRANLDKLLLMNEKRQIGGIKGFIGTTKSNETEEKESNGGSSWRSYVGHAFSVVFFIWTIREGQRKGWVSGSFLPWKWFD